MYLTDSRSEGKSLFFGCKKGCKSRNHLIYTLYCGMDGTRTRDPLRDRQVF